MAQGVRPELHAPLASGSHYGPSKKVENSTIIMGERHSAIGTKSPTTNSVPHAPLIAEYKHNTITESEYQAIAESDQPSPSNYAISTNVITSTRTSVQPLYPQVRNHPGKDHQNKPVPRSTGPPIFQHPAAPKASSEGVVPLPQNRQAGINLPINISRCVGILCVTPFFCAVPSFWCPTDFIRINAPSFHFILVARRLKIAKQSVLGRKKPF
jgi:hypothetical protein